MVRPYFLLFDAAGWRGGGRGSAPVLQVAENASFGAFTKLKPLKKSHDDVGGVYLQGGAVL